MFSRSFENLPAREKMVVAEIWCGIVGVAESPFRTKVDETKSVDELKVVIHLKQQYRFPASRLQLFLAKENGNWMTTNDVKNGVGVTKHILNDAQAQLSAVGLSAVAVAGKGRVHVLALPPIATIFCHVVGGAGLKFPVEIDQNMSVGQLKEVIRERQMYPFDAFKLQLFLDMKHEGEWGAEQDVKSGANVTKHMRQLGDSEARLSTVGLSSEAVAGSSAVRVLVKLPTAASIQIEASTELALYNAVANSLKGSKDVTNLVEKIKTIHEESKMVRPVVMPFIVLESSSGTGKTQMAFNLHATGQCDVFHVLCTKQGEVHHPVYDAFIERSETFKTCLAEDAKKLETGAISDFVGAKSLLVYSFIIAALCGMDEYSGLEATRDEVENVLADRATDKPFVFFLDEFPPVGKLKGGEKGERKKWARMMRNVFRSFRIVVVASATSGAARDLMGTGESSRVKSLPGETRWCVVVPSLPVFSFTTAIDLNPLFKWILEHSRPLFAKHAQIYMKRNPFEASGKDLPRYLTDMAKALVIQFRDLKQHSASDEFELGQFCMLLCTSYDKVDSRVNLINGHYGLLYEVAPFTLILLGAREGLFKLVQGRESPIGADEPEWKTCCRFPLPEEDMLLHLTLMIDHCQGGMAGEVVRPLRQPIHKEWQKFDVPYHPTNIGQTSNDGMMLEALVAGAVVLASHRGGYGGVKFPEFLGRLLFELGVETDPECVKELPHQLKQDTVIPFLSMPNTKWPAKFLEYCDGMGVMLGNMDRKANVDRIDFEVLSNGGDGKDSTSLVADEGKTHEMPLDVGTTETQLSGGSKKVAVVEKERIISGECKDRGKLVLNDLRSILVRVPKLTNVHLVTAQELQEKYFTKKATESAESKQSTTECMQLASITTDHKRLSTGSTTRVESDAPASKQNPSKMSASEYLVHVGLQHADFYRISRSGNVQEFRELMEAKAAGDGTRETGAGKLILFVEVGPISKKRDANEAGKTESTNPPKKSRI